MVRGLTSQIPMPGFRSKLKRIVSRHQAMKSTFLHLKSQIQMTLLQAEEVFTSLSVHLMRLVGLKTAEMAEEGRFITILTKADSFDHACGCWSDGVAAGYLTRSPSSSDGGHRNYQIRKLEEESYATKATMAAKEQKDKQRLEITQLVRLLRQIETQVNSHHGDIRQTLADRRSSLHKSFQKAISYIAAIHHSCQNQETLLLVLNVFQITLRQVDAALNAVESGVEDLMQQLAQQMCNPMVEYVKRLKAEMTLGTFARLLAMVEEMEREIRDGRVELEEERMKVRVAEKRMLEALTRLTELEDRERMKEQLGSLLETRKSYTLRPRKVRRPC
ncbi:hypothetical protein PVL29_021829 [Vitis rotundifolia]|uniref:Uncharacterized protein n=1 Tax=Vitis rotundifolia TaxID=103349 RepID=A0AA38YTN5_VITRO|nr:hypothetical protein PVL29_021829 [Vitis rotundifolia]